MAGRPKTCSSRAGDHGHHHVEEKKEKNAAEEGPEPGQVWLEDDPVKLRPARLFGDVQDQQAEKDKGGDGQHHTGDAVAAEDTEELEQLLAGEKAGA